MSTITDIHITLHKPTAEEIGLEVDHAAYHRGLERFWIGEAHDALDVWIEEHEELALADHVSVHFEWTDGETQVELDGEGVGPLDVGDLEWEIEFDITTKAEGLGAWHMLELDR